MTNANGLSSAGRSSRPPTRCASGSIDVEHFDFWYGKTQALHDINLTIAPRAVTALIGPSGCGKSTSCARSIASTSSFPARASRERSSSMDRTSTLPDADIVALRQRAGMVFQRWNPFPKSIYDNVAFGPRINGTTSRAATST
jgi:phosphate transport system ATP-binding protein